MSELAQNKSRSLIFATAGAAVIGYTIEWRVGLLVLVIAATIAGIAFARAPRE